MKQIETSLLFQWFALATLMAMLIAALIPRLSIAQDYSGSIRASASVAIPFGVGETDEYPESILMVPELSTAFVLFQDREGDLGIILRANEAGFVEFDIESMRLKSTDEAPLLTIILTEN